MSAQSSVSEEASSPYNDADKARGCVPLQDIFGHPALVITWRAEPASPSVAKIHLHLLTTDGTKVADIVVDGLWTPCAHENRVNLRLALYDRYGTPRLSLDRETHAGRNDSRIYASNGHEEDKLHGFFGVVRETDAGKHVKYTLYNGENATRVSEFTPFAVVNGAWPRLPVYSPRSVILGSVQNLTRSWTNKVFPDSDVVLATFDRTHDTSRFLVPRYFDETNHPQCEKLQVETQHPIALDEHGTPLSVTERAILVITACLGIYDDLVKTRTADPKHGLSLSHVGQAGVHALHTVLAGFDPDAVIRR
ncbi:hypothetical protein MBRA1_003642 [Malassezia brasiliensis]|uniref:Uncharacterized protein n=1 Tax=Malassezia brasiliensis TaxID=1821822 RepID=A0AAF0IRD4_9BASI|nr:hypothetical protein MBRA1_003642 [Malassezia brasiliensis]